MKLNDATTIILGPPGTGKTRTLIDRVSSLIADGVPPEQIGYISFTRQAVREARERIRKDFPDLPVQSFCGFRTLHSMIYWILGMQVHQVITTEEVCTLNGSAKGPHASRQDVEQAQAYSHIYDYSRVTKLPLGKAWEKLSNERCGTEEDFLQWVQAYKAYKRMSSKVDFNDMVDQFIGRSLKFPFQHLFIDEAQDFTPSQWAAAKLLASASDTVTVAGDSDQTIFSWAGVQAHLFDELEGERVVLDQSHRLPKRPHSLATCILTHMKRDVLYKPTELEGSVEWLYPEEADDLPYDNGETWYVLARNQCYVKQVKRRLFERQVFYKGLSSSYGDCPTERMITRIQWYKKKLAGGELTRYQTSQLESVIPDLSEAVEVSRPWHLAFQSWPIEQIKFFMRTEHRWHDPKVFVGTFHSSKGAEADNVVLVGECTRRVSQAFNRADPNELRVLYVAATRTKNNLYLLQSSEKGGIPWHHFLNHALINGQL